MIGDNQTPIIRDYEQIFSGTFDMFLLERTRNDSIVTSGNDCIVPLGYEWNDVQSG